MTAQAALPPGLSKWAKLKAKDYEATIGSLGTVGIRPMTMKDLDLLRDLKTSTPNDSAFLRGLVGGLVKPPITSIQIYAMPDEELRQLAAAVVAHEAGIAKHVSTGANASLANLRHAFESYLKDFEANVRETVQPLLDYTKSIATALPTEYIRSQLEPVAQTVRLIHAELTAQARILSQATASIAPILEEQRRVQQSLLTAIQPQIDLVTKLNRSLFEGQRRYFAAFHKEFKITREEAVRVLRKYKWFISPGTNVRLLLGAVKIGRRRGNQRGAMNKLFIEHFAAKDYRNLRDMVDGWHANPIFRPRQRIFRDATDTLRQARTGSNPSNVVLPALICQIDGVMTDFLRKKGAHFEVAYDDYVSKGKVVRVGRKSVFAKQLPATSYQELQDLSKYVLLDILFQKSQPGKPLETPFTFSRHKIIHGESTSYGRRDNVIRAFLTLDFLYSLSK